MVLEKTLDKLLSQNNHLTGGLDARFFYRREMGRVHEEINKKAVNLSLVTVFQKACLRHRMSSCPPFCPPQVHRGLDKGTSVSQSGKGAGFPKAGHDV